MDSFMVKQIWARFCLLLGVSSNYDQPIPGKVYDVTGPVIGRAQPELTPCNRRKTGPDLSNKLIYIYIYHGSLLTAIHQYIYIHIYIYIYIERERERDTGITLTGIKYLSRIIHPRIVFLSAMVKKIYFYWSPYLNIRPRYDKERCLNDYVFSSYYFVHGFYEGYYDAKYTVAVQMFDTHLMYEQAGDVINEQQEIMTSSTELDEIQVRRRYGGRTDATTRCIHGTEPRVFIISSHRDHLIHSWDNAQAVITCIRDSEAEFVHVYSWGSTEAVTVCIQRTGPSVFTVWIHEAGARSVTTGIHTTAPKAVTRWFHETMPMMS